jgi:hypothetical protein
MGTANRGQRHTLIVQPRTCTENLRAGRVCVYSHRERYRVAVDCQAYTCFYTVLVHQQIVRRRGAWVNPKFCTGHRYFQNT